VNLPQRTTAPHHAVFYFDFGNPFCYFAAERIPAACREASVSLTFEPVDGSAMDGQGPPSPDPRHWTGILELASKWGLALAPPAAYPFDSRPLLRACLHVRDRSGQEAMAALSEQLWIELWKSGNDPADTGVLLRAGRVAGVPEAVLRAGVEDPRTATMLERVTRRAWERGVRAIPAVQVEDDLFAGFDHLADAESRLTGRGRTRPDDRSGPPPLPDWTFSG
jgi:2-hydroxychromene-2-carboxylate isomerase